MMQKTLKEPPHPPLSPVAGERDGVRGRKPLKVKSSNALPLAFKDNKDKVAKSDGSCFFALVEITCAESNLMVDIVDATLP